MQSTKLSNMQKICKAQKYAKYKIMQGAKLCKMQNYGRCKIMEDAHYALRSKCWNCDMEFSPDHQCYSSWPQVLFVIWIHVAQGSPCWGLFWRRRQYCILVSNWIRYFRRKNTRCVIMPGSKLDARCKGIQGVAKMLYKEIVKNWNLSKIEDVYKAPPSTSLYYISLYLGWEI